MYRHDLFGEQNLYYYFGDTLFDTIQPDQTYSDRKYRLRCTYIPRININQLQRPWFWITPVQPWLRLRLSIIMLTT